MYEKEFYTVLIEAIEDDHAFVQVFWAFGNHMGEAIDSVMVFAEQNSFLKPIAAEADCFEFDNLPEDACKDSESGIYYMDSRHYFPKEDYSAYQLPYGVILSCIEGELDVSDIHIGFTTYEGNDGITYLEVVVDRANMYDLFIKFILDLPSIRVLWIKIAGDWEAEDQIEFYANEKLNNISAIENFISNNYDDLMLNGYLTLTVYSSEGSINLNLDSHRKISISSPDKDYTIAFSRKLESEGYIYIEYEDFNNVVFGYYHWHYRSSRSRNRIELIEFLKENGFYLWRTEHSKPSSQEI